MKKLLSLVVSGLLVGSLMVGCSDDTKDKTENSNNTRQEQKAFKEEIITDNEYIKMTLVGKEKNEYGFITLKVLVENKTDNDLIVYTDNTEVNGVMNEPYWTCNVNGKSKAYSFIEWDPDSDTNANIKTVDDLKNIKGEIYITGDDYVEIFRTQISILNDETKESNDNKEEVVAEKPSSDKTDSKSEEKKVETKTASNEKKQTEPTNSTSKKSENNNSTKKEEPTKKEEAQEEAQEIKKQNKVVDKNEAKENKTTDTKKENTSSKIKQYKVVSDKPNKAKQNEEYKEVKSDKSKYYCCDKCGKSVKNKKYYPYCYNCYIRMKKQVDNMNKEDDNCQQYDYCDKCGKVLKNKEYYPYCYKCYIRVKKQVENMNNEEYESNEDMQDNISYSDENIEE